MTCIYCESPLVQSSHYRHWRFCTRCESRWVKAENQTLQDHVVRALGPWDMTRGRPNWGKWR